MALSDEDFGEVVERLRPFLASIAAATYTETLRNMPRLSIRTGTCTAVRPDLMPPEVSVDMGDGTTCYAQAVVESPEVGSRVLVMYVPPSGAITFPFPTG